MENLNCDSIEVKPRAYDWARETRESDDWNYWESARCESEPNHDGKSCGGILVSGLSCDREGCGNDGWYGDGPMMNYFYELPKYDGDPEKDAALLVGLPLCIVRVNDGAEDAFGLALTGGGMDLSWEICAAYVALGYRPPVHFCRDLPDYAGSENRTKERRKLARVCAESLRIQSAWNRRGLERLRAFRTAHKKGA